MNNQRKEFRKLKSLSMKAESWQYPGYPFSLHGVIDFKTKNCWTTNNHKSFKIKSWLQFVKEFDSYLLYHILGTRFGCKGNFVCESKMANYETFLHEKDYDDYYIDNLELTRLYFAVWSAIREYKDTDKLLWFIYDGDSEYADVLLFDNIEQINKYAKEYGYNDM